jgi:hypothetical protein
MEKLKTWLAKRSASLSACPGGRDEVSFLGGSHNRFKVTVSINSKLSYQTRLAVLLHECGHVAIYRKRRRHPTRRVHGCTFREWWNSCGRLKKGTRVRTISTLDEEIAAWELGEELGRRLKIRLARKSFERCRIKCLLTYVRDVGS